MLRIFGILLLSAIPVMLGFIRSHRVMLEKDELQGILFFITQLRQGITYSQAPIRDIVMQIPQQQYEIIDNLTVHFLNEKNPRQAWREARKTVHCKSIQDILQNFFDSLGNSDRITQDNVCQIAIEQLREIQKQINEEVASRSKLSRTIGLLSGAFLAIILL